MNPLTGPDSCVEFYDAPSMGLAIWGPAAGFSVITAVFMYERLGLVFAVSSALIILFIFYRCRSRILNSIKIQLGIFEISSLGGQAAIDFQEIRHIAVYGLRANLMLFLVVWIKGWRAPSFFLQVQCQQVLVDTKTLLN